MPNYAEVAEHEGLVSSSSEEEEEVAARSDEDIGDYDEEMPVSLQISLGVTQLRYERCRGVSWVGYQAP